MPAPDRLLKLDTSSEISGQLSECHGGPANCCAFAPRLSWAVSGGWDGHLLKWDPTKGQATERWIASERPIGAVAVSPDGAVIYAGDIDGRLTVWDSISHQRLHAESVHARPISGIAAAADGRAYATAGWDGVANVWIKTDDEDNPVRTLVLRGHQDMLTGCKFWPDGRWLLTWSNDSSAILWELTHGSPYQKWMSNGHRITAADIAPDATMLAIAADDGVLHVWNLHDANRPDFRWQDEKPIKGVAFSPNARELIVVNAAGTVTCLNVPQFFATCPPTRLAIEAQTAAVPVTGECVAVGSDDGTVLFVPLRHLERCEVIVTPAERMEEHTEQGGLWSKFQKRVRVRRIRRANCPKCGRLIELPADEPAPPAPCPGCGRPLAFTLFSLAG